VRILIFGLSGTAVPQSPEANGQEECN